MCRPPLELRSYIYFCRRDECVYIYAYSMTVCVHMRLYKRAGCMGCGKYTLLEIGVSIPPTSEVHAMLKKS